MDIIGYEFVSNWISEEQKIPEVIQSFWLCIGVQREVRPEPTLEHLWTWLQGMQNAPVVEEVL